MLSHARRKHEARRKKTNPDPNPNPNPSPNPYPSPSPDPNPNPHPGAAQEEPRCPTGQAGGQERGASRGRGNP
eukprot:scaffold43099_cov33-Phaeocystis_antarctica.AAC.1